MRYLFILSLLLLEVTLGLKAQTETQESNTLSQQDSMEVIVKKIWSESTFKEMISIDIFIKAMKGYYEYDSFKKGIISIIDYTKPSTEKRFYVIDLENKTLLFNTLIAHGKNTGNNFAVEFSNKQNSLKSSIGFFKTGKTYFGKHGFSLRLDGLEKGFNDNARKRAVVIHGAKYVSSSFVKTYGRLGRSWGCPALPLAKSKQIIKTIANGTCLFVFGNDQEYLRSSSLLN